MSTIPSAALQIRPPEPVDLVSQFMNLRSAMQLQQLRQAQIQAATAENEQRQQQLQSRAGLIKTIKDAKGEPSKVNLDTMIANGVLPADADAQIKAQDSYQAFLATQDKNTREALAAIDERAATTAQTIKGIKDSVRRQQAYQGGVQFMQNFIQGQQSLSPEMKQNALQMIGQLPAQVPDDQALDDFIAMHNHGASMTIAVQEQLKNTAQTAEANARAAESQAQTAKLQAEMPGGALYSPSDTNLAMRASQGDAQAQATLNQMARQRGAIAGREEASRVAAQTSPQAIAGQAALARAKMQATGGNEQVYATNQQGQTVLMSRSDAVEKGFAYTKVGAHEITEDRQINNRLADVNQKLARYDAALSSSRLTQADKDAMALIIRDDKFKLGAFGLEIPVGQINNVLKAYRVGNMSDAGKRALVAFYNARESMVGYQRVLSGSGRSSEKAMQLNLDALPEPYMDPAYQKEALSQFRENIKIAAQGMPILPGVKTPEEIEQQTELPRVNFNMPQLLR